MHACVDVCVGSFTSGSKRYWVHGLGSYVVMTTDYNDHSPPLPSPFHGRTQPSGRGGGGGRIFRGVGTYLRLGGADWVHGLGSYVVMTTDYNDHSPPLPSPFHGRTQPSGRGGGGSNFQRRRNVFKIGGGGRLCKIIKGGGGGGGGVQSTFEFGTQKIRYR